MFEILATVMGICQGVLAMLNKRSNWVVYVLQSIFLIIFSFQQSLYGDGVQNILMVAYCVYGYVVWGTEKYGRVGVLTNRMRVLVSVVFVVGSAAMYLVLRNTSDVLPLLDSATTVSTLIALVLLLYRKVEAWVVWFLNDVLYMVEYMMLPDKAVYLFMLYVVWTAMAVSSFILWLKEYRENVVENE